jgi:thioester reductase-like protein
LELGGDSLMGFELLTKIEQKFGIHLDLRELLQDASVSGIADYIRRILSGNTTSNAHVDLRQECILPEDIVPDTNYTLKPQQCRKLFLTGATGFLGTNLIHEFIEQYPHDGLVIYCHVRAVDEESGFERIKSKMKHFHCWKDEYAEYIRAVPGDLSQPMLGIEPELYKTLANEIDAVFHNGAVLNFVYPYQYLKQTNVNGTIEALRFTCTGKAKYFHYVSSYSVFDTPNNLGRTVYEEEALMTSEGFSLAYSETKWVSEHLVARAAKRGLKTVVYRPGDICGGSNGVWNLEDMISRLIVGSIQMECIPPAMYHIQMTPVDYVSRSLVYISKQSKATGRHFHLMNPNPVSLWQLAASIRRNGYTLHFTSFHRWKKKLHEMKDTNAFSMLECLFEPGTKENPGLLRHFKKADARYDTSNTQALLNGSDIHCPKMTDKLLHKYLNHFKQCGYI